MAAQYLYVPGYRLQLNFEVFKLKIIQFILTMLSGLLSNGETTTSVESCKAASDWANLPPELLNLIGRKLTGIADFVTFRSVCSSWHSAVCPTDLHPQLPWLVFQCRYSYAPLSFFSPSDNRVYKFHNLLNTTTKEYIYVIGSSYGWLVTIECHSLAVSLLNPITRAQIILPRLPEKEKIELPKALICSNPASIHNQPPQEQELRVVIWCNKTIFFIRHGDKQWGEIEAPADSYDGSMAYFENRLYVVNDRGGLAIVDNASLTLHFLINDMEDLPECFFSFTHLVETRGNLLLIRWDSNSLIQFFSLDRSAVNLKWLRAAYGICGITLLTSRMQSRMQSVSVCPQDFLNGRGNQVYMLGNETFHTESAWDTELVSGVASTKIEMPPDQEGTHLSWMVPSLH